MFAFAQYVCLSKDVFLTANAASAGGELQVQQTEPVLAVDREGGEWALHGTSCGWGTEAARCRSACSQGRPGHLSVVTGGDGGKELHKDWET